MPMYEWKCRKCEKVTDVIRPISEHDIPPEKCDTCGERTEMDKQIGSTNFILQGGGWFRDGY